MMIDLFMVAIAPFIVRTSVDPDPIRRSQLDQSFTAYHFYPLYRHEEIDRLASSPGRDHLYFCHQRSNTNPADENLRLPVRRLNFSGTLDFIEPSNFQSLVDRGPGKS